jgi:hypothetical protein
MEQGNRLEVEMHMPSLQTGTKHSSELCSTRRIVDVGATIVWPLLRAQSSHC